MKEVERASLGPYVTADEVIGARVVSVEVWGPVTVEKDGRWYEIAIREGYSGPEHRIEEVRPRA